MASRLRAAGHAGLGRYARTDFNGELRPGPLDVGFDRFFGMPAVGQHPNIYIEGRRVVGLRADDPIRFINDPRPSYQVDYLKRPRTAPTNLQMASGKSAELVFEECALRLTDEAVAFIQTHHARPSYLAPQHPLAPEAERAVRGHERDRRLWRLHPRPRLVGGPGARHARPVPGGRQHPGGLLERQRRSAPQRQATVPAEVAGHRINGPLRGQKTEVFEGGHRVPFIVRWPGRAKAGETSEALVANTDLLATCAEIVASPLPRTAGEDSYSFLSTLLGESTGQPRAPHSSPTA